MKNLFKIILAIVLFILLLIFFNYKIESTSIQNELRAIQTDSIFTFGNLTINGWDTLYMMQSYGYSSIEKKNLSIPILTRKKIRHKSLYDGFFFLLFTNNRKLTDYVILPRTIANFDFIEIPDELLIILPDDKFIMSQNRIVQYNEK
ncbi:hypothetical protein [Viscerimonas tarda]